MSGTDGDWSKPAAMAIPKEGYFEEERGRYGPIFPRTPACYGFSIIAKVKEGREDVVRAYGKTIEETIAASPEALAPLQVALPAVESLRRRFRLCTSSTWASSTPTSTSTPRTRSQLFSATGITTIFTQLEGFPGGLEGEPGGVHQVRPRPPVPELPGIRRVPVRHRR